jgi:hypothetical protein
MSYTIETQSKTKHRDTFFTNIVMLDDFRSFVYGGIPVFIIQFESDMKWWMVPDSYDHDEDMEDLGPYDTPEDAILMLRLTTELIP